MIVFTRLPGARGAGGGGKEEREEGRRGRGREEGEEEGRKGRGRKRKKGGRGGGGGREADQICFLLTFRGEEGGSSIDLLGLLCFDCLTCRI